MNCQDSENPFYMADKSNKSSEFMFYDSNSKSSFVPVPDSKPSAFVFDASNAATMRSGQTHIQSISNRDSETQGEDGSSPDNQ